MKKPEFEAINERFRSHITDFIFKKKFPSLCIGVRVQKTAAKASRWKENMYLP